MNIPIYDMVALAKRGDISALKSLIQVFKPLVLKLRNQMDGDDTEQELTIFLWQLLYKLPLQNDALREDKIIFSYIAMSIKRQYFKLHKQQNKIKHYEISLSPDLSSANLDDYGLRLCLEDLIIRLSPSERKTLILIYSYGYSAREIAMAQHKSTQAVNQMKLRALKKLRMAYLGD